MMMSCLLLLVILASVLVHSTTGLGPDSEMPGQPLDITSQLLDKANRGFTSTEANELLTLISYMSRQVSLQGFAVEERIRSDGASGIKQTRQTKQGTKSYMATSYVGNRVCAIHEHSNSVSTVGMGETVAVLNGVEFRTRHNDYKLKIPSRTSTDFHATEPAPFPEVPQSVKDKETVDEEIVEMREYFKAWKDNDPSHRNFTDYFKPLLCYMEGAWTTSDQNTLDESFDSDRHFIDATSWLDLQEKVRFTSYTGRKDPNENYAYLPTTIANIVNKTLLLAQWNYRILCHPIKRQLHPSSLRLVDDLHARMAKKMTMPEYAKTRAGRFKFGKTDTKDWKEGPMRHGLLDEIMEEIPGKDNYPADLKDDSMGSTCMNFLRNTEVLNTGYYHRCYKMSEKDAMGSTEHCRTFSDEHVYMAMNSQSKIPEMSRKSCDKNNVCKTISQRWSYAIPLEIVYQTPLWNWNPYDIEFKGKAWSKLGKTVTADGRNGGKDASLAYNGTNNSKYYRTPANFFGSSDLSGDPADTAQGSIYVLDNQGIPRQVVATGTRIQLPEIPGVGELRTRYPVMPTHQEGSAIWKEIEALKDIALNPLSQKDKFYEDYPIGSWTTPAPPTVPETSKVYKMYPSSKTLGTHMHYLTLTDEQISYLEGAGTTVTVTTTESWRHTHELVLKKRDRGDYEYILCDGRARCFDFHWVHLRPAT